MLLESKTKLAIRCNEGGTKKGTDFNGRKERREETLPLT